MRLLPGIAFLILLAAAVNAVSIDSGVLTELQDSNEVSVIVMLEEDASLADVLIEKEHEFGEMNGFSGTVSRESLGNLLNNVDVAGIQLNKPVSILMTQGAPLINATQAWALTLNGTNITGRGETVCVIDTGIDYNHTSLGGSWGSRVLSGYNYCANDACSQESGDPYDNHGHGTHVAGIIASNDSTNRGIAPDANLIAIKALNSAGSGTDDDVIAGINWCIANATAYNISVISMSIGSGSSTGYCDSSESAYSTAINSAVAKNISVVIASGNDASNTSISVPGCIENATTVGAVYDADIGAYGSDSTTFADKITYYTNRNSRLDFLAPGSRITSTLATVEGGGFGNKHGTSMATPMVSGAFALLHQYKKLDNGTILNPSQIENTFRLTGVNVSDSRTGLNFTRISAYAAIRSIDTFRPLLTMLSPLNATYNTTNISLSYSASDNIAIDACTFTNTTGSTETLFGCSNTTFLAAENQQNNITLSINDSNGNTNSSQIFFFVDTALPLLSVFQPQNATYNTTNISLQYGASDGNSIDRCWFVNITGASSFLNNPRGTCNNITFTAQQNALNNITVYMNDTGGSQNSTQIFFTVDLNIPSLAVQEPRNASYTVTNISVNYTSNGTACWLVNTTGDTITLPGCSNATILAAPGANNITIAANNSAGNVNSTRIFFTVDTISPFVNFTASTANNETFASTNDIIINATSDEFLDKALLEWNGANLTMNKSDSLAWYSHANLPDGNYTFRILSNDTAGNINVTAFRWVYINATRNFTSFVNSMNTSLSTGSVTFVLLNTSGTGDASQVFVDVNYTFRFNASGIIAEIANFSWLAANTSNIVNVTRNITLDNISAAFNSSGGLLDNYVWIDVNNFTDNYTPRVTFTGMFRLNYYINGTRESPDTRVINDTCNNGFSNTPCYSLSGNTTIIALLSFSGAAVGNDTQPPSISISSPTGTYSGSNVSLNYSASDNVGLDKCSFSLNGAANVTPENCSNTTFTAASGSNTLTLYANDTSGNSNSTSVTFTYSAPAQQTSSSSGGGGGGGGGSTTTISSVFKKSWDVISGSASSNISINSLAVKSIVINVNSTARSASISISPEKTVPAPLENAYQYFSVNTTNLGALQSAEIRFAVNKSWVDFNEYDKGKVALNRFSNGWMALPTLLIAENSTHLEYVSTTTGFSYFAVTGERTSPPATNQTEPEAEVPACIQMIQPATKDGVCVNYPTPCDVPEGWTKVSECQFETNRNQTTRDVERNVSSSMLTIILTSILAVILVIAAYKLFFKKKMKKRI